MLTAAFPVPWYATAMLFNTAVTSLVYACPPTVSVKMAFLNLRSLTEPDVPFAATFGDQHGPHVLGVEGVPQEVESPVLNENAPHPEELYQT